MNIVLIGYRCSGKTTIGKRLSYELGKAFIDTDTMIETREGRAVHEIVAEQGWARFRSIERNVIKEISGRDKLVVAAGGGIVLNRESISHLKRNGLLLWLKVGAEVLKSRMGEEERKGIQRPPLNGFDPIGEITQVLESREPLYEEASDIIVDCGTMGPGETTSRILELIPEEVKSHAG